MLKKEKYKKEQTK